MALATRCPECETIFRISTTQAAAKGGMVRCGQCRHVFNSLDALVRVEDLDVVEEVVADSGSALPARPAAGIDPAHAAFTSGYPSSPPGDRAGDDLGARDDAASIAQAPVSDSADEVAPGKWWLPHDGRSAAPSAIESAAPKKASAESNERPLSERRVSLEWPAGRAQSPEFLRATPRAPRSRTERWALAALSIIAALGLAAQVVYVWRNELAVRWPAAKPWLVAACAPLRCVVDYPVHIDAIRIESTALQSSAPNSNLYTLTALLRNRDTVAVRYPYLELTLTDTQDRPVLRRALRPEDYLAPSRNGDTGAQGGFSAESELPIRVMFELNDLRFVGYRLDRFYP